MYCLQEEEKEREEDDAAAVAAGEDAMNANQSPESEYDRDREVMQRCVKLILQGRPQIMMPLTPKVWKKKYEESISSFAKLTDDIIGFLKFQQNFQWPIKYNLLGLVLNDDHNIDHKSQVE